MDLTRKVEISTMASEPQVKKQKLETEETLLEEIDNCQNDVSFNFNSFIFTRLILLVL